MPSIIVGNPLLSGMQPLFSSGSITPYSGLGNLPIGGIQFAAPNSNSGTIYLNFCYPLSGAGTLYSGGFYLSGNLGLQDMFPISPGSSFFCPKSAIVTGGVSSGTIPIFVGVDPAGSGQSRLVFQYF